MRTIFNILGPLTNPADAPNILMGVFHPDLVGIQVRALQRLGAEHAVVVYGKDGMDEVSLGAATMVGELQGRRDPRVRDPSRGLRPDDGEQPRAAGRDAGASRRRCSSACSTTSRARRATSSSSTPAPRCTRRTSRRRSPTACARARAAIAAGAARAKLDQFVACREAQARG